MYYIQETKRGLKKICRYFEDNMLTKPIYYTLNCYELLYKNMKRHQKLLERLEELYLLQEEPKDKVPDFTNVVDTGLMDSIITKNIIECEDSRLIDKMSYKSGEITEFDAHGVSMFSKLDVSLFSQFKGLSKALGTGNNVERLKLDDLSPIHRVSQGADELRSRFAMNKLNIKSIETIVKSIKAKYCKNKFINGKEQYKFKMVKHDKPNEKLNIKSAKDSKRNYLNINNLKNAFKSKNNPVNDNISNQQTMSIINTQRKPESADCQRNKTPISLRRQPERVAKTADSVNGTGEIEAGQKPIYNINFNLNLNLNMKDQESKAKPKLFNNLDPGKSIDRNPKSAEGKKNPFYKSINIKSLYYKQLPVSASDSRKDIESYRVVETSRSRSSDKYKRSDYSKGILINNSATKTPRKQSKAVLNLKEKIASAPLSARRPGKETSQNNYFLKNTNCRDSSSKSNNTNSYNSSSIKSNSVIRTLKGDITPLRINLNTKNITGSIRQESSSKERIKNKVFK
jgi:hypothetical protein